jgi:hypothetical protein
MIIAECDICCRSCKDPEDLTELREEYQDDGVRDVCSKCEKELINHRCKVLRIKLHEVDDAVNEKIREMREELGR